MLQLIEALPPRWQTAVWGALLGDALGVPHEFKPGHLLPDRTEINMCMSDTYPKTYSNVPYGTWSDDGSQLLALLDALHRSHGVFEADTFTQNLLDWFRYGRFQAGGLVFDCGAQTRLALDCLASGQTFSISTSSLCGNGSLMRVLPVAALPEWLGIAEDDALAIAVRQSAVTHPQPLANLMSALYVALCWEVKKDGARLRDMVENAAARLLKEPGIGPHEAAWLPRVLDYGRTELPTGSGYVLNTFWSAVWAVERSTSLSDALRRSITLGNDTDTVACIAGGLAALAYGMDDTSEKWKTQLRV